LVVTAGVTTYFLTPHGRDTFKGIRSNITFLSGQVTLILDQVVTQFDGFPWDAYLERWEALVCQVVTLALSGFFSALKVTDR
jgi:hypothetical protein